MVHLIIHVGPGKCGSSSIQDFFRRQKRPCLEKIRFTMLDPTTISGLNFETPDETRLREFAHFLSNSLTRIHTLIISHEYLFDCPYAIRNICNIAKNLVTDITIIGYCRRQADLMISVYSQWLFRSPDRVEEATGVVTDLELDAILFSGLERHLIASIANDFYSARQLSNNSILDWHKSYQNLSELVHESGAVVQCGLLPDKEAPGKSLVQDFCEKSGLTLHKNMEDAAKKVANTSFNHDLIEAVNNAVTFGLEVPGPHECNEAFGKISSKMSRRKTPTEFLYNLKAYVDTYFSSSNIKLCDQYGFSKKYFYPPVRLSKGRILDIIMQESRNRALDSSIVINKFRLLAAVMALISLKVTGER